MSINGKQIVALGLGLGIATAFAFRTLHHQDDRVLVGSESRLLQPIRSFEMPPMQLPGATVRRPLTPAGGNFEVPTASAADRASGVTPPGSIDREADRSLDHPLPPSEMQKTDSGGGSGQLLATGDAPFFSVTAGGPSGGDESAVDAREFVNAAETRGREGDRDLPVPTNNPMPAVKQDREAPVLNLKGWQSNPFVNDKSGNSQSGMTEPAFDKRIALSSAVGEGATSERRIALAAATAKVLAAAAVEDSNQFERLPRKWPAESPASAIVPEIPRGVMTSAHRWESTVETGADSDLSAPLAVPEPTPAQIPLPDAVAQRAVHHIEYGKTLARRGAGLSARQEFLAAVQILAESNDQYSGGRRHTVALRRAMLIIKEAEDFGVGNAEQQILMDLPSVVEAHQCQVVSVAEATTMSPGDVLNRYFEEAQRQLDLAGGRSVVSAEVFYCLGKLQSMLPGDGKVATPLDVAKTVVFHQAALKSDARHHRSANELGVIFARQGRLEQSKSLFEASLLAEPSAATWQNLAQVHARLGETELAQAALNEYTLMVARPASGEAGIQWQEAEQFNSQAPVSIETRMAKQPESAADRTADESKKSLSERFKTWF